MQTVSVAEAKARLSEILARVEGGGEVVMTRRGHPVARLSALKGPKTPIDFGTLDSLRARQAVPGTSSVELIRRMRDEKY
jgi:antitoxin (DNA-binding transcriptional repressor) of toxin-antitoxin stability system